MTSTSRLALAVLLGAAFAAAQPASADRFLFVQPGPGASAAESARVIEMRDGVAQVRSVANPGAIPAQAAASARIAGTGHRAELPLASATAPLTSPRPVPRPHALGVVVVPPARFALAPLPAVGVHRVGIARLALPVRYTVAHAHDRHWFHGFPGRTASAMAAVRIDDAAEDALDVMASRSGIPEQILNDPVFRAMPMRALALR